MERENLSDWQKASDQSDVDPLTTDLPKEYPLGGHYRQEVADAPHRVWRRLDIVSGRVGARWCYWYPWTTKNPNSGVVMAGVGPNPDNKIIADTIFNGDAPHFVGMLGVPYSGIRNTREWVLISPRMTPPREIRVIEEKQNERYERSRDVYDVETGETTHLK